MTNKFIDQSQEVPNRRPSIGGWNPIKSIFESVNGFLAGLNCEEPVSPVEAASRVANDQKNPSATVRVTKHYYGARGTNFFSLPISPFNSQLG